MMMTTILIAMVMIGLLTITMLGLTTIAIVGVAIYAMLETSCSHHHLAKQVLRTFLLNPDRMSMTTKMPTIVCRTALPPVYENQL